MLLKKAEREKRVENLTQVAARRIGQQGLAPDVPKRRGREWMRLSDSRRRCEIPPTATRLLQRLVQLRIRGDDRDRRIGPGIVAILDAKLAAILAVANVNIQSDGPGEIRLEGFGVDILFL